jgi:hypothetical protein
MQHDIDHWHIVQTMEEMVKKAIGILNNPETAYTPVLPYAMDNSARAVMQLFNYNEAITS